MPTKNSFSRISRGCFPSLRGTILFRKPGWLVLRVSVPAVFLVAALTLPAWAGFVTAPLYPTGDTPWFQVVADFNGDGIPDLAVPNTAIVEGESGTVAVLLGNGDGTLQPAQRFAVVGPFPTSLAVGDFNGDDHLDLAVSDGSGVSILLGNGDGTFQPPQSQPMPSVVFVAAADFNGDGIPDLAIAQAVDPQYIGSISILLGNGDGTFQIAGNYQVGVQAFGFLITSIAVGDLNGDGRLDLAVANAGSNSVSVLVGNGDGSFQPARNFAVDRGPVFVAVGDVNGDGIPDLVTANSFTHTTGSYANSVTVLLGNGDGTFQAARNYPAGLSPSSVAVGDYNGDGRLDLAVKNNWGITILFGQGDGSFAMGPSYAASPGADILAVADFNHDGHLDLAVASDPGAVSLFLGRGDGTFASAPSYPGGDYARAVAVGDFNGDGIPDVAVANDDYPAGTVAVFLGNGDGTLRLAGTLQAGPGPVGVAVADFNRDGYQDLLITNYYDGNGSKGSSGPQISGVRVFLGNGDGTFQRALPYTKGLATLAVAVGDFNGDGFPDLAVAQRGFFLSWGDTVQILLGNGDGTFQAGPSYNGPFAPTSVVVGDFNGDGKPDIAFAGGGGVSVLLGNGDGTFQVAGTYDTQDDPGPLAVGDFNGDGNLDIAVAQAAGGLLVLFGNGDGTFLGAANPTFGLPPRALAVGDFNGDGLLDLAATNLESGTVSVLLGNGNGTFLDPQEYPAGSGPYGLAVADLNGDRLLDLAVADLYSGTVTILINDGH
jgi:hypothetical protein